MTYPGKAPIKLAGHFWFNSDARNAGRECPAIVELLPYRRRDGTMRRNVFSQGCWRARE